MMLVLFVVIIPVGAVLAWWDLRVFAVYAFAALAFLIVHGLNGMERMLRVAQFMTSGKLLAVARHVGVSDEDFEAVAEKAKQEEGWERLEKHIHDQFRR